MTDEISVRAGRPGDVPAIRELYAAAFPGEDLLPLVSELLGRGTGVVSLVATAENDLAGHIVFTACGIAGATARIALLGPLAVAPDRKGRGVGSALIRAGLARVAQTDASLACVLGDPAYYGRFGFAPERGVAPPYPLPNAWDGAWKSRDLQDDGHHPHGTLCVPAPWRREALWVS
jgi:putative acetyltransferase